MKCINTSKKTVHVKLAHDDCTLAQFSIRLCDTKQPEANRDEKEGEKRDMQRERGNL